ncbi:MULTISPECIES: GGDEF domain-containing protein [Rhizobium]|uniref:GGDEF domain-containing protein n=1 Tax=Rhizobium TaxID=379 RepID=UPI001CD7E197|nr:MULTISPECIES: GGDEF domain-containing protein [Rhizobium]MCA0805261.1 GGDEF domain-containing protein [Rhizobium sp. T1473]MCS0462644.1 GGDEF domain-containing protein [Rhizobium favelukesii]UFS80608.1 GGDEF domain-containing protein [Rhizobium sp. T136]
MVVIYSAIAAAGAGLLLTRIENEAIVTRERQIPLILSQTRNAVKIERMSSLVRAIFLANDRRLERQLQLQIQALAQGFGFDGSATLTGGSRKVASLAKTIAAAHQKNRDEVDRDQSTPGSGKSTVDLVAYEEAMRIIEMMGKEVSGNSALVADEIAGGIQKSAVAVRNLVIIVLIIPALSVPLLLLLARRHFAVPIVAAISNLKRIEKDEPLLVETNRPLLKELALIGDAIISYGNAASELRRTNVVLQALAEKDPLTGLANRRTFEKFLAAAIQRSSPESGTAVLLIDIDHFKSVNDRFGHPTGDRCLKSLASLLENIPDLSNALAARFGGEEFVVVYDAPSSDHALEYARFVCRKIEQLETQSVDGTYLRFTGSIGVSFTTSASEDPGNLLEKADRALYDAKRSGRNRAEVDSSLSKGSREGRVQRIL